MTEEYWLESYGNDYKTKAQDNESTKQDDTINFTSMFEDPDPYDTFEYTFNIPNSDKDNREVRIKLHGIKQENGQLLNSTGLTVWKASLLMCNYLIQHQDCIQGKRVLEVSARQCWYKYLMSKP